jgi:hypothetical protein
MSKDDLPGEEEGWDPDDEKLDKKMMRKLLELTEKQIESFGRIQMHRPTPPPGFPGIGARIDSFEIRPISNGFLIRYWEMGKPLSAPVGYTAGFDNNPHQVEAFVGTVSDVIPHLEKAMGSMRAIFDLENGNRPLTAR